VKTSGAIEVRRVASKPDLDRAFEIRRQVFLEEQKVSPELEYDDDDRRAVHVVAARRGEVIATGRIVFHPDHARVGRMAVLAEHRGRGVGRAILLELLRAAGEHGARHIVLHAQVQAIGFYESLGFVASGDVFDEAGIPHRQMERAL
jgi:predicted GNAT family N-acyltransferase